jgi:DivIVA domain-containing protein
VLWFEVLGGVAVLLVLAYLLSRDAETLAEEPVDAVDPGLPADRLLRSEDIPGLRFRVGLRGYRMSDVDAALDAVARSLAAAEASARASAPEPPARGLAHGEPVGQESAHEHSGGGEPADQP